MSCSERLDFLRRRRQADQVEIEPANQGPAVGVGDRLQSLRLQPRQHEAVDVVPRPLAILDPGRLDFLDRLERPEALRLFERSAVCKRRRRRRRAGRGAHPDPLLEVGDDLVRQFLLGGHLDLVVPQCLDQQAALDVAGDNGRAAVAAFAEAPRVSSSRPPFTFDDLAEWHW